MVVRVAENRSSSSLGVCSSYRISFQQLSAELEVPPTFDVPGERPTETPCNISVPELPTRSFGDKERNSPNYSCTYCIEKESTQKRQPFDQGLLLVDPLPHFCLRRHELLACRLGPLLCRVPDALVIIRPELIAGLIAAYSRLLISVELRCICVLLVAWRVLQTLLSAAARTYLATVHCRR